MSGQVRIFSLIPLSFQFFFSLTHFSTVLSSVYPLITLLLPIHSLKCWPSSNLDSITNFNSFPFDRNLDLQKSLTLLTTLPVTLFLSQMECHARSLPTFLIFFICFHWLLLFYLLLLKYRGFSVTLSQPSLSSLEMSSMFRTSVPSILM